jgi:hypothetical protein
MAPAAAEATGLETLKKEENALPGIGGAGRTPESSRSGGRREKPMADVKITCGKRSPG